VSSTAMAIVTLDSIVFPIHNNPMLKLGEMQQIAELGVTVSAHLSYAASVLALSYTILYYTILYYTTLHYIILHYCTLDYTLLTVLYCALLHCAALTLQKKV
jgi:hypothetical protein